MKKYIIGGIVVLLLLLQFVPVDTTLPAVDANKDFLAGSAGDQNMAALVRAACYDCHSNTTAYPWYSKIQPVAMWMQGHVDHGRENVNFSEWQDLSLEDKKHVLKECVEVLEEKRMPMLSYMIMHGDAWISDEQRTAMADYFRSRKTAL